MSLQVGTIILTAAVGAVVSIFIQRAISQSDANTSQESTPPGNTPPHRSQYAGNYSDLRHVGALDMEPYPHVYGGAAAGRQGGRSNFNGHIFAHRFHRGLNPNYSANFEQSYAFQSSTKNPFANGNNCTYARAVNNATQDPTNQCTPLVLGTGTV